MTDPITPPLELVDQWVNTCLDKTYVEVFTQIAQWGADQELDACCEVLDNLNDGFWSEKLRAARRPKPPSLKAQALAALEVIPKLVGFESERDAIRRALEALDD